MDKQIRRLVFRQEASDGLIGPLFHASRLDREALALSQEQALVPAFGDAKRRNVRVIFAHGYCKVLFLVLL
jgi:hypothetical protein